MSCCCPLHASEFEECSNSADCRDFRPIGQQLSRQYSPLYLGGRPVPGDGVTGMSRKFGAWRSPHRWIRERQSPGQIFPSGPPYQANRKEQRAP
jgi:hypothetical protein